MCKPFPIVQVLVNQRSFCPQAHYQVQSGIQGDPVFRGMVPQRDGIRQYLGGISGTVVIRKSRFPGIKGYLDPSAILYAVFKRREDLPTLDFVLAVQAP